MIATGTINDINKEISQMKEALRHTIGKEERVAINNYLCNLYRAKEEITGKSYQSDMSKIFSKTNTYKEYLRTLSKYEMTLIDDYLKHRNYHKDIIDEILSEVENAIEDIYSNEEIKPTILSERDFKEIFMDFLKEYKLDGLFEKLIKKRSIFITNLGYGNDSGFSLFNPITNKGMLFILKLAYTLPSMFTLAHEVGHIFDYTDITESQDKKNIYMYENFFGEVISKLFERLFLSYLIKKNILSEEAKDKLTKMLINNYDFLLTTYILNLLDEDTYLSGKYHYMSGSQVYEKVKDNFKSESEIFDFLVDFNYFDVLENFTYVYGDILSLHLQEAVESEGLDTSLLNKFKKQRFKHFDEELLKENDINPKKYMKLYRRDIDSIKNNCTFS